MQCSAAQTLLNRLGGLPLFSWAAVCFARLEFPADAELKSEIRTQELHTHR
jgi:hypothetical protein